MDPDAAMRVLLEAIEKGNKADTITALIDLKDWLGSGGFMPVNTRETVMEVFGLEEPSNDDPCW